MSTGQISTATGKPINTAPPKHMKYVRPWIYEKQERAIFNDKRYSLIEASTKTGKTAGCIIWLLEQALKGVKGQNFWWVAPVTAQAEIAFNRMRNYLQARDLSGHLTAFYKCNLTKHYLELYNGTIIWFKGADKPDSLYGEDVWAAVVDEASRVKEDAFTAVRSTLTATNGPMRVIGNVKGRTNWFYRMCRMAQQGHSEMHYHKLTAYDAAYAGVLDWAEIKDAKRLLPEHTFRELYLAEPSDDGGNPFGLKAIQECILPGYNEKDISANDSYLIWESGTEAVAWGWDLAKSHDFTVGTAFDKNNDVCQLVRFQTNWPDTKQRMIDHTCGLPALIDSTGVGDPILDDLQRKGSNWEGFKFTSPSKQQLMEGLASDIHAREIRFPPGVLVIELEQFEYEVKRTSVRYTAPEGLFDDCVCSLALANKKRRDPGMWNFAVG